MMTAFSFGNRAAGRIGLALLLAVFISPLGKGEAQAAERLALIVGNGAYSSISSLKNPPSDARQVADALGSVGFRTSVIVDADQIRMKRAIVDFGRALRASGADAVGLFYYAGHGVQAHGRNFLIPVGTDVRDEADLDVFAVGADWILRQMESAGNAMNIVILDACRNNPFDGTFRSSERGLARIEAPTGSFVAYATAPGAVAVDGEGDNSPYTAALIEHITAAGVPIEQVFKHVRREVLAATGGTQTPWDSSSLVEDFYFVPGDQAGDGGPDVEARIWNEVRDSGDADKLDAFLDLYPESRFRSRALALRQKLDLPERTDAPLSATTDPDVGPDGPAAMPDGGGGGTASAPKEAEAQARAETAEMTLGLTRDGRRQIQRRLTLLGHGTRGVDGLFGPATRAAIRQWQRSHDLPSTGYLDAGQIRRIESRSEALYAQYLADQRQAAERRRERAERAPSGASAGASPARRSGRYISADGCMREADGRVVIGFKDDCG